MRLQIGNQTIEIKPPQNLMGMIGVAFVGLLLYTVYLAYYTVKLEEEAVITRFGKYKETKGPGLHFKIPFVDVAHKLDTGRQLKMEFGFIGTPGGTNLKQYSNSVDLEKSMVTGDLNAATVEWVVQYKISDARKFLFNLREPEETLRDASEAVMREVVGDRTVDEVITVGRQEMAAECQRKLTDLVTLFDLGVTINQIQLRDTTAPDQVKKAFTEVNQAQQERETAINVAHRDYNKAVPTARGNAASIITAAQGYATKRVNEAEGDVAKFVALYGEYQKSPEVTKQRIYLETMEKVLPAISNKVIIDEGVNQVMPYLPLDSATKKK
jgi:modulator of FtsH protease HflK